MTRTKAKYKHYLMLFFVVMITYLVSSLYHDFGFLDFGYLITVIVVFIRFLKEKEVN